MKYKIISIFVLAFLVRLIALNQSIWLDEATTAKVVEQYSLSEIIFNFSPRDFHPPLYYLLMKTWTNIFGYTEISIRFPSIIFSLLAGYMVYKITSLFHGFIVSTWAAVFFLFNPLVVYYSQEARMYMMATFFITLSIFYLLKSLKDKKFKNIVLFSLITSFALLTFYGSIFYIVSVVLYLIYKKEFKIFFMLLFTVIVTLLFLSPLLFQQFNNAKAQLDLVPNWTSVLGKANLKNLLLIPLKFSVGRISFEPKLLYWSLSGIWTAIVLFFMVGGSFKNKFLAYLYAFPLILGTIFSFFTPLLQYFRFLYLISIMSILLASGIATSHLKGGKWIVVTGFLFFSLIYILNSDFHRENWKSLTQALPNNSSVYMIASSSDPVKYYKKGLKVVDLKSLPKKISQDKLYVIPYTADIHGVDYVKNLEEKKFKLAKKTSFRELTLEQWVR